jgi:hypothetical protein
VGSEVHKFESGFDIRGVLFGDELVGWEESGNW